MRGGTMYDQREIVLIPFPYSDLTGSKQRPALIISNSRLNKTDDRICVLITSNKPKDGLLIKSNTVVNGSLSFKSWVKPHRIFTVDKRIIKKRLCVISNVFHNEIIDSLNSYIKEN